MARILIAGCGGIGCSLGQQLSSEGHDVFGLRRDISSIPKGITPVEADLTKPTSDIPQDLDYVFYTASAGKYKDSAYYLAYVSGVKNLLKQLENQDVKRFFFISSTAVFGQNDAEKVDESSPTSDSIFSTKRLLEGEALVNESAIPSTLIRFGGIYGPGRTHLIDLLLEGKIQCMDGVWSNRIHSDDCVGIMKHLLDMAMHQNDTLEDLYVGVDSQPTLLCDVYNWLAEQLCIPDVEHIEPKEVSRQMRSNKRISNAKIVSLGYQFKYPNYQAGYKELLHT